MTRTPQQLDDLERGFAAQARSMREFGYPDVSAAMIAGHHAQWLKGETQGDVIFMFSINAFEKYPSIFGERSK